LHYLELRYGAAGAHLPQYCADEMGRAVAKHPRLRDALGAGWLQKFNALTNDERIAIERMREDSFGESDPLEGLGECAAIYIAEKTGFRLGIEDRVGRRLARRQGVDQFHALQIVRALYRYCEISPAEAWNLYALLRDGSGAIGSKLTSIGKMRRGEFDAYLDAAEKDFA